MVNGQLSKENNMAKVEIEIPNGKVADVTKDSDRIIITFNKENFLSHLKDLNSVKRHIKKLADLKVEWAYNLWKEYIVTVHGSYSEKICLYRMVVAALTNNEERYLTTGKRWYPAVQFCEPGKEKNCWGSKIIGTVESEGQEYTVVSGCTRSGSSSGLSYFDFNSRVSQSDAIVGFRSVSSKEVAEHISIFFGRLLFEIHYGGVNCDWKWIK